MKLPIPSPLWNRVLGLAIGGVWIFHGFYSKILDGIPRHRLIVERILGSEIRDLATVGIGLLEISLGLWVLTGKQRIACVSVQTAAIISMNTLEILLADDLLISGPGMLVLNAGFLTLGWYWALAGQRPSQPA